MSSLAADIEFLQGILKQLDTYNELHPYVYTGFIRVILNVCITDLQRRLGDE